MMIHNNKVYFSIKKTFMLDIKTFLLESINIIKGFVWFQSKTKSGFALICLNIVVYCD